MTEKKTHFSKNGVVATAICRQNAGPENSGLNVSQKVEKVTCRVCLDILGGKITLARYKSISDLPPEASCRQCRATKPIGEMMVAYLKKEKLFRVRPRCKQCHNEREKGHRRDYKRRYLQNWRKKNSEVNKSYRANREYYRNRARKFYQNNRAALLIQIRLRYRGRYHTLEECRSLLKKFGPFYPLLKGLSKKGRREAERIRSRMRNKKAKSFGAKILKNWEIRLMVYEDAEENQSFLAQNLSKF